MSNAESNAQLDARLAKEPERDGVEIYLDHEGACKLYAIIGLTECGVFEAEYKVLGQYVEDNDGEYDYTVDLDDQSTIKVVKA